MDISIDISGIHTSCENKLSNTRSIRAFGRLKFEV